MKPHLLRLSEYHSESMPSLGPESISVVLTNACNLNCITCWSYSALLDSRPSKQWSSQQLSWPLLEKTLQEAAMLGTQRIIYTGGGDPLIYPQFYEAVQLSKALGLKVTLISNLTLVKDAARFADLGIDTIQANFSAADEASYVAFHPNRKPEHYGRLIKLLDLIAPKTDLKLVCVVCQTNVHLLKEIIDIASDLQAKIQFKLMSITPQTGQVAISETQRNHLQAEEETLKKYAQTKGVLTNLEVFFKTLDGQTSHDFPIDDIGCFAGYWYSRVQADGSVWYCCNTHPALKMGSLHQESFTNIWQSESYQEVRHRLKQNDFLEGCQRCGKFDLNFKLKAFMQKVD